MWIGNFSRVRHQPASLRLPAKDANKSSLSSFAFNFFSLLIEPKTVKMSFYDEIEIEDMTYHEETTLYTYPCPCGDQFEISLGDLRDGEEVAVCPSCSLQIKVIFDVVRTKSLRAVLTNAELTDVGCFAKRRGRAGSICADRCGCLERPHSLHMDPRKAQDEPKEYAMKEGQKQGQSGWSPRS